MTASAGEELVEWVDANDRVVSVVTRRRMRAENLRHRSVSILVLGSDGRLLVHQRSDDKDLLPGWWDVCVGGVVGVGEAYDTAAVRELAEEVGVERAELVGLGVAAYDGPQSKEISHLYRVVDDGPFTFADGEVAQARFVTPSQFAELADRQPFLPGGLEMVLGHLPSFARAYATVSGRAAAAERLRWAPVHRVEFTIEPFIEGRPGPHVTAPLEALEALGVATEVGPFGSGCSVSAERTSAVVSAVVSAAFDNGATHLNIDITRDDER